MEMPSSNGSGDISFIVSWAIGDMQKITAQPIKQGLYQQTLLPCTDLNMETCFISLDVHGP